MYFTFYRTITKPVLAYGSEAWKFIKNEERLPASEIPLMKTVSTQYYIINKMETFQKNYQFTVNY